MLRNVFNNLIAPRVDNDICYTKTDLRKSESKLALWGLLISTCAIMANIYFLHSESIKDFIVEKELLRQEFYTENGDLMFKYVWSSTVKNWNLWMPLLCGFLATYFTWVMVYLDSAKPGIEPPSPLSPSKYKTRSGHTFHLSYVFAILIGISVTFYMYLNGN